MSDPYLPGDDEHQADEADLKTPFSFKLMVVAAVLYLGWRLVQGIVWVVERLS